MATILIVEDEEKIARFLELELAHDGYGVETVFDGRTGLTKALSGAFDLVVLDLMLPQLSGIEVCRRIRQTSPIPIIMLTAKDDVSDKVTGLDMGADDYITKPFAIEELLARIRTALKRKAAAPAHETLCCGGLLLDKSSHSASYEGHSIELTKKEFDLLAYLLENEGVVLTRNQLLDKVWGYSYMGDTNIVDVYIRYLRSKIDEMFGIKLLHTVRGVGYVLRFDS